jgi:hypothetical protein
MAAPTMPGKNPNQLTPVPAQAELLDADQPMLFSDLEPTGSHESISVDVDPTVVINSQLTDEIVSSIQEKPTSKQPWIPIFSEEENNGSSDQTESSRLPTKVTRGVGRHIISSIVHNKVKTATAGIALIAAATVAAITTSASNNEPKVSADATPSSVSSVTSVPFQNWQPPAFPNSPMTITLGANPSQAELSTGSAQLSKQRFDREAALVLTSDENIDPNRETMVDTGLQSFVSPTFRPQILPQMKAEIMDRFNQGTYLDPQLEPATAAEYNQRDKHVSFSETAVTTPATTYSIEPLLDGTPGQLLVTETSVNIDVELDKATADNNNHYSIQHQNAMLPKGGTYDFSYILTPTAVPDIYTAVVGQ